MKKTRNIASLLLVLALSWSAESQTKKPITNNDLIRLIKNGFADEQIIAVIEASEPKFDVSVDALIELKNAGSSQKLIETILLSGKSPQASAATKPAASGLDNKIAPPAQPYIQVVLGSDRSILPSGLPTLIQTNAKGNNMATIAADDAVRGIASSVITSAASTAILAGPGVAAIPIVGVAGAAISRLPGLRRDPQITLVYALPGRQSANLITADRPKFELFFGDVVGANPADFIPVIVKVTPTENNWRLTGAQKTTARNLQSRSRTDFNFIEDAISSRSTTLGRGNVEIEPQNALPMGEYAIVLRPVSKSWKVDMTNLASRSGEGILLLPVWDFALRPETPAKP